MDTDERRLDGNAVGGLLGEIFPLEMTMAHIRCAGCNAVEPLGAETVYKDAPGMVMRCTHCQNVLLTVVRGEGHYWIEMRGATWLQIPAPSATAENASAGT
jgi:phage FluMu protein Com